MVDLREVVIFGREPEHGDRGLTLPAKPLGVSQRGQCFVEREDRAGIESYLLSGCDNNRVGAAEEIQIRGGCFPRLAVLCSQRGDQAPPMLGRKARLLRGFEDGFRAGRLLVKRLDAVELVQVIRKQRRRARHLSLLEADTLEIAQSSTSMGPESLAESAV